MSAASVSIGTFAEFDFRWNARKIDDGERTGLAIRNAAGKRLRDKEPLASPPVIRA
jgi:hypothetical protein